MSAADDFASEFWDVVEHARGDEARLRAALTSLPREALINFYGEFRRALRSLWNKFDAAGHLRPGPGAQISEDEKEDVFAYVVSQGRGYYDDILSHPERLRRDVDPGDVPIVWIPGEVFWKRFGEEITLARRDAEKSKKLRKKPRTQKKKKPGS